MSNRRVHYSEPRGLAVGVGEMNQRMGTRDEGLGTGDWPEAVSRLLLQLEVGRHYTYHAAD